MKLNEAQAEAILWLSSGGNAAAWKVIEDMFDKSLESARDDLEKNSDPHFLHKRQGAAEAYRGMKDLRERAEKLLVNKQRP